ncbi:fumarylacetoacetate hydrolase family protein [Halobacillus sp. BBL2006]|uniref:fumarylacetoacetate hydrolase family protein n=1 Tax=Halobacillus sp. BBL2006 TaxID=1543706 RepID=UPI0005444A36|nr:fumarylacetoacetate hydrolase family protein [Halobacillus sp. BBL2006]KHE68810.1 ureidoglycolate lyase [Halobacillus sp. BBL2006]
MKFARFSHKDEIHYGVVKGDDISVIEGDIYHEWSYTGEVLPLEQVELLAPAVPSKIIGIGANYVGSAEERPEELPEIPVFFFKPSSSVIGTEAEIVIPDLVDEVKFESELAVVIGKETRNVAEEDVLDHIFGYTIGNDVTAPQFFHEDGHWTVGKSFDTFTPIGPYIETELDPSQVSVKADINGVETQNSPTNLMIVPLAHMVSYLSKVMTLEPGDCILTGSPLGAYFVKNQDVIECKIDEIGTLKNRTIKSSVSIES